MFIETKDPRNSDVLLAFNGEVVGFIREAFVATKANGGYVIQGRLPEEGEIEPIWIRLEGDVAYLGAYEDPAITGRRLSEERIRLGLPMWHGTAEDLTPEIQRDLYASHLESLAMQIRRGGVVVTNVHIDNEVDRFPLPNGDTQFQPSGKMSYGVDYDHKDAKESHAKALKQWSEAHPDLVPEYIRNKKEGPR